MFSSGLVGGLQMLEIETPRQGFPPAEATLKIWGWVENNCFAHNRSTRDRSLGLKLVGALAEKKWRESTRQLTTITLSENYDSEQELTVIRNTALAIASFLDER